MVVYSESMHGTAETSSLALGPELLLMLAELTVARNRKPSLLQLLLDNLPSPDFSIFINRCDTFGVDLDVRELVEFAAPLDFFIQRGGLRGLHKHGDQVADCGDRRDLRVEEEVARQLVDALVDLE